MHIGGLLQALVPRSLSLSGAASAGTSGGSHQYRGYPLAGRRSFVPWSWTAVSKTASLCRRSSAKGIGMDRQMTCSWKHYSIRSIRDPPTELADIGGVNATAPESSAPVEAWLQLCSRSALTLMQKVVPREFLGVGYDAGIKLTFGASTNMS
jgi:hypothetical protein